jgi:hypothetical protein
LNLTTNVEVNADPFTFAIPQNGANIPTTNPNLNDAFLQVDVADPLTIIASPSDRGQTTPDVPAPMLQAQAVPEPTIAVLLGVGLATAWCSRLRRG